VYWTKRKSCLEKILQTFGTLLTPKDALNTKERKEKRARKEDSGKEWQNTKKDAIPLSPPPSPFSIA
jgi:hypothetical protein